MLYMYIMVVLNKLFLEFFMGQSFKGGHLDEKYPMENIFLKSYYLGVAQAILHFTKEAK